MKTLTATLVHATNEKHRNTYTFEFSKYLMYTGICFTNEDNTQYSLITGLYIELNKYSYVMTVTYKDMNGNTIVIKKFDTTERSIFLDLRSIFKIDEYKNLLGSFK